MGHTLDVKPFDGTGNFPDWLARVKIVITSSGAISAIQSDARMKEGAEGKFSDKEAIADAQARGIIISALSEDLQAIVNDKTAFEAVTALNELFAVKNTAKLVNDLTLLLNHKMAKDDTNGRHFTSHWQILRNNVDTKDLSIDDVFKLVYLASLNSRYQPIAVEFGHKKLSEFKIEDVKSKVFNNSDMILAASGETTMVKAALRMVHAELLKHKLSQEDLYQSFRRVIENVSVTISSYQDKNAMGSQLVSPEHGIVAFGSRTQGWCFALRQFATRYAKELGIERSKLMAKLWGDNFYDSQTKTWSTQSSDATGKNADRGFNLLVLDPIYKLFGASLESDADKALALADKLGIIFTAEERALADKALPTAIMGKHLSAADALVDMFCIYLPLPAKAQSYRCSGLYEGPQDNKSAARIRACDPSGPLVLYVLRMVPASDKGRFYAFGRMFSRTVKSGQRVRIQSPNYTPGKHTDLFVTTTQSTVIMMGSSIESIDDCPAGNIVGLVGIDQYLLNSGTITTSETAHSIKAIKFSVSPVVQVAVSVANPKDLPKLVEGLKRLSRSDPCVQCHSSTTGEFIDLEEYYAWAVITKSAPFVKYYGTILAKSSGVAMAKSPNKHNRLYLSAEPIQEELATLVDNG
ncbi:translation elongation factor 2 [Coemansia sp. RSA 2681]|nr:translation elongation factor 2 [Coemansia sp. RSA 2681]